MAPQPTTQQLAHEFATRGAFAAINHYVSNGTISSETASQWTARVFQLFAEKTREAQNEVRRLDPVLDRLAQAAARGSRLHPYDPRDPLVLSLAHELTTFDNWVISLYETDLTMIWYGAPERAQAKPLELAKSMDALRQKRIAELNFHLKDAGLFTRG